MFYWSEKALVIIFIALSLSCAERFRENQRREFVNQLIQSAYEESDFYRRFTSAVNQEEISNARSLMTPGFRISGGENYGVPNYSEYIVEFENGERFMVDVITTADHSERARIRVPGIPYSADFE